MAKYSTELKMKVLKAYQNNEGGYEFLAKKHGISNKSIVRRWINAFNSQGYEGVIAAGIPCKVIRKITEEDKNRYPIYIE